MPPYGFSQLGSELRHSQPLAFNNRLKAEVDYRRGLRRESDLTPCIMLTVFCRFHWGSKVIH